MHVFISFLKCKQLVKQCIITKRMKSMPAQIVKFFSQLAMANSNSLFPYLPPHPLIDCPWQLSVSTDSCRGVPHISYSWFWLSVGHTAAHEGDKELIISTPSINSCSLRFVCREEGDGSTNKDDSTAN